MADLGNPVVPAAPEEALDPEVLELWSSRALLIIRMFSISHFTC